jgi:hypothetical protein
MPLAFRVRPRRLLQTGDADMRKLYLLALAASAALVPAAASAQGAQGAGHSWREGPQFVVRNWHGYGFPQPFQGGRWIRYYDDALLIDRHGRVHDGRYGYDWDPHGDRWGYNDRGVPIYVGDGDFEPNGDDYEWAERWEEGEGDVYADRGRGHGGPVQSHGYGHGYAGGYGYGCGCGPVVVTETTTTTAPVVEQVTTYEYVTEYVTHRAKAAPRKRKLIRRAPAPAPARPGERG